MRYAGQFWQERALIIGLRYMAMSMAAVVLTATVASAQEMPADYKTVLSALGKS
jgi:hypothetical protein